jgi:hypothetical protein
VTVYEPLTTPLNTKFPDASAVTLADEVPLSVTVAELPPLPLIDPDTLKVGVTDEVKLTPVTFAPLTVTFWLAGAKVMPALVGVTV